MSTPSIQAPLPTLSRADTAAHSRLAQDAVLVSSPLPPPPSFPLRPLTPEEIAEIKLIGAEDSRGWSHSKKWRTTVIISLMGFISPLGSSILVPGNGFMDNHFGLGSRTLSLLPVSLFVLGLGFGPFILAPCSETVGRQPVYVVTSAVFIVFNLASPFSPTFAALNILRFLAGAAGSAGPSLGAGSIGDMFSPKERGRAQSLYGLGPLMGPVLGSIIGCFIAAGTHDWKWLLHTLTILSAVVFVVILCFLNETYAPVLLRKKRERAIEQRLQEIRDQDPITATLIVPKPSRFNKALKLVQRTLPSREILHKLKIAQSRPFRLLFTNPICAIFSYYLGFCYAIIYLFITQHPLLFQTRAGETDAPSEQKLPTYNWKLAISGLSYLGLGLGFLVAAFTNVMLQDEIYARLTIADGEVGWWLTKDRETLKSIMRQRAAEKAATEATDVEKEAQNKADEIERIGTSDSPAGANSAFGNVTPTHNPDEAPAKHLYDISPAKPKSFEMEPPCTPTPVKKKLDSIPNAGAVEPKKGRPEFRLPLCFVGMLILPCGLLLFGWSAANQTHWIVPLLGSFVVGCATILCFQTILVYLVDAFVPYSASATACAVLIRSILAAALPLCAEYMFERLGWGFSCTLLAGVGLIGLPVPLVLYRYGESLRNKYKFKG